LYKVNNAKASTTTPEAARRILWLNLRFISWDFLCKKWGCVPGCNIPCNSAGRTLEPLYFGARMSHQAVGTNRRKLRRLYEMVGIPVRYPPNGVPKRLISLFGVAAVCPAVANSRTLDDNATNYHL
jgi:hypothetical protein